MRGRQVGMWQLDSKDSKGLIDVWWPNNFVDKGVIITTFQNKLQAWVFDIVTHQMFEITIMILIIANMVTMMIEHHGQPESFGNILEYINYVFVAIFTGEAIIKVRKQQRI